MKKRSLLIAMGVIIFGIIASIALVSQIKKKEIAGKKAFPQHTVYQAGTIKPDNLSQEEMDAAVANFYETWKSEYLKQPIDKNDQYYIFSMIKVMQSPRMQ